MPGPIPYQILPKPIPGKWYVCELLVTNRGREPDPTRPPVAYGERRLSGPHDTSQEAEARQAEIKSQYDYYLTRTEIWNCP